MGKKLEIIAGVLLAVNSFLTFQAFNQEVGKPEMNLLRGAAIYAKYYGRKDPDKSLDYVQRTLEIVRSRNPNISEISGLQKDIGEIRRYERDDKNKEVRDAALNITLFSSGATMKDISDKYYNRPYSLWLGILNAIGSLGCFVYALKPKKKRADSEVVK